jgi:peptidoglycan/LPS O-acetylase OafA/YrhL
MEQAVASPPVKLEPRQPDAAPERLHALDAVRGGALLLGIVYHATISFIPTTTRFWIVEDLNRSDTLAVLFFVSHVFRMTTFFLIAGFFAHMSFHRRGPAGFLRDRLIRIAVPLVVAWPFVYAALHALIGWGAMVANGGRPPRLPPFPTFPGFPLTHLWFLYVLLELYAVTLLLRGAVAALDRSGQLRATVDRVFAAVLRSPLAVLVFAVPIALAFVTDQRWFMWFGVRTPDFSFITNPQAWAAYGTAFGVGWLLHRRIELLQTVQRRWPLNLALAIALTVVSLAIATTHLTPAMDWPIKPIGAACYALASWTATLAVIGLALRFLSDFSATRRYVADASYWLYIVHLPLVVLLQIIVARLGWPWPVKFALILAVSFPIMFASYHWLVRFSVIGTVLNGRRARKAA